MGAGASHTVAFAIRGPITRAELTGLCTCVCELLSKSGADVVLCDVSEAATDAVTVDALARLQLATMRRGCGMRLVGASRQLRDLVDYMGLGDVLKA